MAKVNNIFRQLWAVPELMDKTQNLYIYWFLKLTTNFETPGRWTDHIGMQGA